MLPQIYFLKVEIITLLIGATFSIASMSLGMYWSRTIFSPIVKFVFLNFILIKLLANGFEF